jgi:hypothetical protein
LSAYLDSIRQGVKPHGGKIRDFQRSSSERSRAKPA